MSELKVNKLSPRSGTAVTLGDSGDTFTIPSGATLAIAGSVTGFTSAGIDDNATSVAITINSSEQVGIGTTSPSQPLDVVTTGGTVARFVDDNSGIVRIGNNTTGTGNSAQVQLVHNDVDGARIISESTEDFASSANRTANLQFKLRVNGNVNEIMRLEGSNVGIGTSSPGYPLEINSSAQSTLLHLNSTGATTSAITFANTGSNDSIAISAESDDLKLRTDDGVIKFFTNENSEKMRIDSSGNVMVGTTSSSGFDSAGLPLIVGSGSTHQGITIFSGTTHQGAIHFADGTGTSSYRGQLNYKHDTDAMTFATSGGEKARLDASGNFMVGKTATGIGSAGAEFKSDGRIFSVVSGNYAGLFNRLSSDGDIVQLRKDGTTVGSIGVASSDNLTFGATTGGGSGLLFYGAGGTSPIILPMKENAQIDNAVDLGGNGNAFKDLYLGGGVYLGGTGSANKLDDYEEGLHEASLTPSASGSVNLGGNENTLSYVKIGHLVNVQGQLSVNTLSSPVGYIKISMPFTAASLTKNSDNSACSLLINNVNTATVGDFVGIVQNGTSELRIYLGDTTYANEDSAQELRSGTSIYLNVSYRTT